MDHTVEQPKGSSPSTGNSGIASKTGNRTGRSPLKGLLFDLLRRSQERRRSSASSKLKTFKQIHKISEIQDGNECISNFLPDTRELVSKHRPSRRLLTHSHPSCSQAISPFRISRQNISVSSVAFRPDLGSESFYYGPQPCGKTITQKGSKFYSVSRRLSHYREISAGGKKSRIHGDSDTSTGGISGQPEKIPAISHSRFNFSGNEITNGSRHSAITTRKSPDRNSVRKNLLRQFDEVSSGMPETIGSNGLVSSSSPIRSFTNETFSDIFPVSVERTISVVRPGDRDSTVSQTLPGILDGPERTLQRSPIPEPDPYFHHLHRRFYCGMGWSFSRTSSPREMEGEAEDSPHQLSRAFGGTQDPKNVCQLVEGSQSTNNDRQHFSSPIYKQDGRNKINLPMCSDNEVIPMVHGKQDNLVSSTCTRSPKRTSGQSVQKICIQHRVAPKKTGCLVSFPSLGRPVHRSIRLRRKQTLSNILLLAARYKRLARRCSKLRLARHVRLRFPTDSADTQSVAKSASRSGGDDSNRAMLASKAVVSHATQTFDEQPSSSSAASRPVDAMQRDSVSPRTGGLVPGSLEDKSRYLQTEGLSEGVAETILAARAPSTYIKYESCWKDFHAWATERGIDPVRSSVAQVLDYLQHCAKTRNLSCSSVRSRLYAISLNHKVLPLEKLSGHTWVRNFLKGMNRLYPTIKSRHPTWNLQLVLQSLRGHPFEPLVSGRIKMMTYKVAFLLAITTAKRVGELKALSVDQRYLTIDQTGIRLRINPAFIPKVNNPQNREKEVFFTPFCPRNNTASNCTLYTLCIQRAVKKYVQATKAFRKSDQLLICFAGAKKGQAATKTTISRWVRTAVQSAYRARDLEPPQGIKAHDTRGVAASWAQFNNASLSDICDTASWSNQCTFATHYQLNLAGNRPSARFGNAVLQTVLDRRPQ